jgi:hypothetical protein
MPHELSVIDAISIVEVEPGTNEYDFILAVNGYITEINRLIDAYNQVNDVKTLIEIEQIKTTIEGKYPAIFYSGCLDYVEIIQINLFNELQAGFTACGFQREEPCELAHLIRTIPYEELAALYEALINIEQGLLVNLPEKFKGYGIVLLSNGNNFVYQFTELNTGKPYILSIGDLLNRPKELGIQLGNETRYVKNPYVSRQYTYGTDEDPETGVSTYFTWNINVFPFYKQGSLDNYHAQLTDNKNKLQVVTQQYVQMVDILLDLQNKHRAMPDAKYSNWMVDDQDNLVIIDTKSMIAVNEQLDYQKTLPENRWYNHYIFSEMFADPQLLSGEFNADSLHVFIVGRNLSFSLIDSDYDNPILETPQGEELATLIEQMTTNDLSQRITLSQVKTELEYIQNPRLRTPVLLSALPTLIPETAKETYHTIQKQIASLDTLADDEVRQLNKELNAFIPYCDNTKHVFLSNKQSLHEITDITDVLPSTKTPKE